MQNTPDMSLFQHILSDSDKRDKEVVASVEFEWYEYDIFVDFMPFTLPHLMVVPRFEKPIWNFFEMDQKHFLSMMRLQKILSHTTQEVFKTLEIEITEDQAATLGFAVKDHVHLHNILYELDSLKEKEFDFVSTEYPIDPIWLEWYIKECETQVHDRFHEHWDNNRVWMRCLIPKSDVSSISSLSEDESNPKSDVSSISSLSEDESNNLYMRAHAIWNEIYRSMESADDSITNKVYMIERKYQWKPILLLIPVTEKWQISTVNKFNKTGDIGYQKYLEISHRVWTALLENEEISKIIDS